MTTVTSKDVQIAVNAKAGMVSALMLRPPSAKALLVIAHGAGAGMRHRFMEDSAAKLAANGIATLRYQFPYMEKQQRRPDPPAIACAAVRAAVAAAARAAPGLPLIAGGKSFGGRMTSTAQSQEPLPGVVGLAFLGFPLHPPGQPGVTRAQHFDGVNVPLLFLQGDRDEFAELILLRQVVQRLGKSALLRVVKGGDHSFNVPKSSGRTAEDGRAELADAIVAWADSLDR